MHSYRTKKIYVKIEGNHPTLRYMNYYPKTEHEKVNMIAELKRYGYEIAEIPFHLEKGRIIEERDKLVKY